MSFFGQSSQIRKDPKQEIHGRQFDKQVFNKVTQCSTEKTNFLKNDRFEGQYLQKANDKGFTLKSSWESPFSE